MNHHNCITFAQYLLNTNIIIKMVVINLKYGELSAKFHEEVVEVFRSRVIGPTFVA